MLTFDPFGKSLRDLRVDDLVALRQVSEGWYVEYKEHVPSALTIAKSISSFANHYGGWIFYGIAESRDGEHRAEAFHGISALDLPSLQQRIRDAVRIQISPPPFFDLKVLRGPSTVLSLSDERAIIIIRVPPGSDLPYVHASGRIYRRIADSSDPIAEKDRSALDILWQRGEKGRRTLSDFLSRRPRLSKAERNNVYLILFMVTDPYGDMGLLSDLSFNRFAEILRTQEGLYAIPLENAFTTNNGFIARQITPSQSSYFQGLSFRHYFDGSSMVILPLRYRYLHDPDINDALEGYNFGEPFVRMCLNAGLDSARMIDLNICIPALVGMIRHQRELLLSGGLEGKYFVKCRVIECWRCIPFIDTSAYLEFVDENGIPLISDEDVFAPPSRDLEAMLRIGWPGIDAYGVPVLEPAAQLDEPQVFPPEMLDSIPIFIELMRSVGVAPAVEREAERGMIEFVEATHRAIVIHRRRTNS